MREQERTRRRAAETARVRRQRRLAAITALVLVGGGVFAVVAYTGGQHNGRIRASSQSTATANTIPARAVVAGSKANESASKVAATSATITTSTAEPLRGKTVAIDPGHNGGNYLHTTEINRLVNAGTLNKPCDTTGTETDSGYTEAAYTLDVSLRLAAILRKEGAHVVLTRSSNSGWGPCITERAAIGNRAHANAAISIHADGGPAYGRGFHVIYPPPIAGLIPASLAAVDRALAVDVRNAYEQTGMPTSTYLGSDGLDERSDLGGLNLSTVPKVFIETGNMRNATDAALLETPAFRQSAARAIARGIAMFLRAR